MKESQLTDLQTPYQTPPSGLEQSKSKNAEYAEFRLFSTTGRIGRIRYFVYSLGITLLQLGIFVIARQSGNATIEGIMFIILWFIVGINLILTVQRLHDVNINVWFISGLFILGWLVPITRVLLLLLFVLLFVIPGTDGPNRFGLPSKPIAT
jgi:uncharacterized membrane protein YhaH (DUF805 family)